MARYAKERKAHATRWTVKQISGPQKGLYETFASEALARMECNTLADMYGVLAIIYPPRRALEEWHDV